MLSYEVKDLDTSSTREQSLLVRRAESCTALVPRPNPLIMQMSFMSLDSFILGNTNN